MSRYKCMKISNNPEGYVYVDSTDWKAVKAVEVNAEQLFGEGVVAKSGQVHATVYLSLSEWRKVYWGLIDYFCDEGWEPFSNEGQSLWLRKKKEG